MKFIFEIDLIGGAYFVDGVKRTIEIGGSSTLDDLCIAILNSINFDDDHLYDFDINGVIYEKMKSEFGSGKKTNVKIYSTGIKKGSVFRLNYDYGDDWIFRIKVKDEIDEKGFIPAKVIDSKGEVEQYPDEDWYEEDYEEDYAEGSFYDEYYRIIDCDENGDYPAGEREEATLEEWKQLYELAAEFKKKKPWTYLMNSDVVEVRFDEEVFGDFIILGNGGMEYGFSLYLGDEGYKQMRKMVLTDHYKLDDSHLMLDQNSINMWLDNKDEVPPEQEELIKNLGLKFRGKNSYIYFEKYSAGFAPYILDGKEVRICTEFLRLLLETLDKCKENINEIRDNFTIFSYELKGAEFEFGVKKLPEKEQLFSTPLLVLDNNTKKMKKSKKNNETWELDMQPMGSFVEDENYSKMLMPATIMLASRKNEQIIAHSIVEPHLIKEEEACSLLANAVMNYGKPKTLVVKDYMILSMVADVCKVCGIELAVGETGVVDESYEYVNDPENDKDVQKMLDVLGIDMEEAIAAASKSKDDFMEYTNQKLADYLMQGEFGPLSLKEEKLTTQKQKIQRVLDAFGEGEYDEDTLEEIGVVITSEWADRTKDVVSTCSKKTLENMVETLGLLVNSGAKKETLVDIITDRFIRKPQEMATFVNDKEKKLLKTCLQLIKNDDCEFPDECSFTSETVIGLIEKGMLDVKWRTSKYEIQLVLCPLKAMEKIIRK
ncbi:DUF7309 domain-containing protein [Butyrivibrio sp. VCD2006]|uniref:DUF7309 domain-containing protein n=1 Tax=Butyrivibrio sp. VCD2006 TaxID=1280664 RepID=UPI00040E2931|nr:hypothetical protein [Butyrivibrio sp. VCD2006]